MKVLPLAWRPLILPLLLGAVVAGGFVVRSRPNPFSMPIPPSLAGSETVDEMLARGIREQNAGAHDAAISLYEKILQPQPDHLAAHYNLALIYAARGDFPKAQAEYEATLRADPKYVDARINLGIALYRQRKFAAAAETFRQAVAAAPKNAMALFDLGITLVELDQPDEAIRWLTVALAEQPDLPNVHYYRGLALKRQGKLAQAERELQQELARNSRHADAYRALAEIHLAQGRKRQADEALAKAAELTPAPKK